MIKRGLTVAVAFCLAITSVITARADNNAEAAVIPSGTVDSVAVTDYLEYLSENSELVGKGEAFQVNGVDYLTAEGAEVSVSEGLEWTNASGSVTWKINVPSQGAYKLEIEYMPLGEGTDAAEISVSFDGKSVFEEASSLFLPFFWENDGDIRTDAQGNEFAPEVKKVKGWQKTTLIDPSGFNKGELVFALDSGEHTVTLTARAQSFAIKTLSFSPVEDTPSYKEYIKKHSAKDYNGKAIVVEGENAITRSKKSIVPLSDNSSASVYPKDAFLSKINYIGSKNWSRPGDTVVWEIDVPEDGMYSLNFSYRQNYTMNETFYRILKVDGKVPFSEAEQLAFEYSGSWGSISFADGEEPYKLFLEKGKHTLSLSVTMGPMSEVCGELDELVYELAGFYRNMVMITGENPDANRDYNLFKQITNYDSRLKSYMEKLDELLDMLYKITGDDSGTAPTNLRNMKDVLKRMRENKYYAHQYKQRYYDNYAALSAWVYERSSMPLDIDAIFITAPDKSQQGRQVGFFKQVGFSIQRFVSSFVSQYVSENTGDSDNSLTLWINWGRDQAKVLKNLVNSDFTAESGVNVNIRVTNATLLQGILSGNGPDCSIQVSRSEPVNLAMRGGLYDLSKFEDYEEIMERFMPGAGIPYEYNGGNYGIPNTQTFYMMFYRTDILEQMGIKVPETWDEFLNTANVLLRKNMQVGLPYIQITDMSQVNAGVGALNIFPTLLMQRGQSLYTEDLTASTLTEPETIETFVGWTEYYTKYSLPKTFDFYNRFRVGLMPIAVASYAMYATLTAAAPEISQFWEMAPIPGVLQEDGTINRTVSGGGTAAIILKDSKNPELAWEFIKWWTEADTQYSYASEVENILGTSARHDSANVEALKRLSWDKDNLESLLKQWEDVKEIPEIPGGYYLARVIDQAFWNTTNGKDPYEMMAKWGKIADDEIERKGKQYGGKN